MVNRSIQSTIQSGKITLSLEFFPPKREQAANQLLKASEALKALNPDFVSITYGAGGSTQASTVNYAETLKNRFDYEVMPHLTCVGHSQDELKTLLKDYQAKGIRTIMALRGDPPQGDTRFQAHPDGFHYASELVAFIQSQCPEFEIGVGGYPEKHPEAPDLRSDIVNLKKKVDAGASFITTQLFYENEHYFRFVEQCRDTGIHCPIIPGLMIPSNLARTERFCDFCGAELPQALKDALTDTSKEAAKALSVDWTYEQIKSLIQGGAPGIHLYILNQSEYALALHEKLLAGGVIEAIA